MNSENTAVQDRASATFWRGALQPSWLAAILTVAVCALVLWAVTTFVSEHFVLRHADWFRIAADDPALEVTVRSLQLSADLDAANIVAIVGARDEFSDGVVDALVSRLPEDGDWNAVVDLTTPQQTLWESVALVDRLPMTARGVVLLDACPARLQVSSDALPPLVRYPNLGVRSRAFDDEVQRAGLTARALFGNFFLDNQTFLLHRAPYVTRNLLFAPPAQPNPSREKVALSADPSALDANRQVLKRLVDRLKRKTRLQCLLVSRSESDATDLDEAHRRFLRGLVSSRVDFLELDGEPVDQIITRLKSHSGLGR